MFGPNSAISAFNAKLALNFWPKLPLYKGDQVIVFLISQVQDELMRAIESQAMGPYYKHVCKELKWPEDQALSQKLAEQNEKTLKELVRTLNT